MALETTAAKAANETVRIPANVMGLLRQSYDTREKMLDWMLAIGVVAAMTFAFRHELWDMLFDPDASVNAGRVNPPVASQDIAGAFPFGGQVSSDRFYTYNMPSSRSIQYRAGPSGTRPPWNPSQPPAAASETGLERNGQQ